MFGVLLADNTLVLGNLPVNSQIRVVEQDTTVSLGVIEIIAFIGEDGRLAQHGETMRKTFGDEELTVIVGAQFYGKPLTVGLAALAYIHCDIQHPSNGAGYQFGLRIRWTLEMQTAHDTVGGTGLIVLHKSSVNTCFTVPLLVVRLYEITTCVCEYFRLNDEQSLNRSFDNFHKLFLKKRTKVQQKIQMCKILSIFFNLVIRKTALKKKAKPFIRAVRPALPDQCLQVGGV